MAVFGPSAANLIPFCKQIKVIVKPQRLRMSYAEHSDGADLWPACLLSDASGGGSPAILPFHSSVPEDSQT